jgi:hypothetical protein
MGKLSDTLHKFWCKCHFCRLMDWTAKVKCINYLNSVRQWGLNSHPLCLRPTEKTA